VFTLLVSRPIPILSTTDDGITSPPRVSSTEVRDDGSAALQPQSGG
jgi:hypothetical protein